MKLLKVTFNSKAKVIWLPKIQLVDAITSYSKCPSMVILKVLTCFPYLATLARLFWPTFLSCKIYLLYSL
jgi:hypothetical protein